MKIESLAAAGRTQTDRVSGALADRWKTVESALSELSGADQMQQKLMLVNQVQKHLALIARIQTEFILAEATREISQRVLSATILAGQMIQPLHAATQREAELLSDTLRQASAIATVVAETLPIWQSYIHDIIEHASDDLFEDLELYLISEGWYVSGEVPAGLVLKLADMHDARDFAAIENLLQRFYSQRIQEIEDMLRLNFQDRQRILTAAFAAHRSKAFAVSIPTFLAQADGISQELWEENFFRTARSNRRLFRRSKSYIDSMSPTVRRHLREKGALRADFRSGEPVTRLNRHAVLHGTSVDYDTEANSLRCIALLHFLASLTDVFSVANSDVPARNRLINGSVRSELRKSRSPG